jgi:hypothetical protein
MNDISPLVLAFAMFFICLALTIGGVIIWGLGQLKRMRLTTALEQLNEILNLTIEALNTGSREKRDAVNTRIEEWDKNFSRKVGIEVSKLPGS